MKVLDCEILVLLCPVFQLKYSTSEDKLQKIAPEELTTHKHTEES